MKKISFERNLDRYFIALICGLLILFSACVLFLYLSKKEEIEKSMLSFISNLGVLITEQSIKPVETLVSAVHRVASRDSIERLVEHRSDEDVRRLLSSMLNSTYGVKSVLLSDRNGRSVTIPDLAAKITDNAKDRPWFSNDSAARDTNFFTPLYKDIRDESAVITISRPMFDFRGDFIGVVGADLNLIALSMPLRSLSHGIPGKAFVIERTGKIILSGDPNDIRNGSVEYDLVRGMTNLNGIVSSELDNEYFYFYVSFTHPDWFVLYQVKKQDIYNVLWGFIQPALVLFFVSLVLINIVWYLLRTSYNTLMLDLFSEITVGRSSGSISYNEIKENIHKTQENYKVVKERSTRDMLTGLLNRGQFDQDLSALIDSKDAFVLSIVDIDDFKQVNDTYGHVVGDEVLKAVASSGIKLLGDYASIYRYGGEELAVIFKNSEMMSAFSLINAWREFIDKKEWREPGLSVTFSAGLHRGGYENSHEVISKADSLLYTAKKKGKNMVLMED